MRRMSLVVVFLLAPVLAVAEMPPDENIKAIAESWLAKKPAKGFGVTMSMSEAAVVQTRYTALISKDLGDVVGYKAGLTNPAVQKRFGYDKPIRGRRGDVRPPACSVPLLQRFFRKALAATIS